LSLSDAGYVDPAVCASCHRQIAEDYARTGMGRSFRSVRSGAALPEFDGATFRHDASEQYFTPYRKDGKYYLRRHQTGFGGSGANVLESEIDYVFGSGNHARSYLHRTPAGTLIELPLTWYAEEGGRWSMSPAYDRPDHSGFSREATYRCLFCHNGYPEIEPGADSWDGASAFPERLPEGIDCQRCHGPGRDHLNAVQGGAAPQRVRGSIVNPSRLSPERQVEICMQCHLETTSGQLPPALLRRGRGVFSYRAGEPLENYILHFDHAPRTGHDGKFELVSSAYRLRQSRCFLASGGALTCTSCHNPHKALRGDEAVRHYKEACMRCHGVAQAGLPSDDRHSSIADCARCHMPPSRPSDAIHIVITDHLIAARPAPPSPDPPKEEHDGNTTPYSGEVALYYPPSLPNTPENELDLAIAQLKQQSNLPGGLRRLETAIARYHPERSEAYFELGEAYWRAGQPEKAIPFYEQATKRQPARWYHFSSLGIALAAAGQAARSLETMDRALKLAPRETTILYALGEIYSSLGRLREAESTFRKAMAINPEMAEGPNNLGTTLLRLGDMAGAETALREAVRLRPESPVTHTNLADVLSRQGKLAEARYHFESVVRIGPSLAPARSALAATLAAGGSLPKASEQYDATIRRQRSDAENNLGTALAALGEFDQALEHYRIAVDAAPDSDTANLNLGLTLAGLGKFATAAPHLRKAAQSPDPQVRDAAAKALNAR
jgi:predicted CXXCH cytochrome family protein